MKRSRFILLCVLLLSLTSGPDEVRPIAAGPTSQTAAVSAAGSQFDSGKVVTILRGLNPHLSERDLQRIAVAILDSSEDYGVDPVLVTAVMWEESNVRPWARSEKGAIGLMQVMPHMSAQVEMAGNLTTIENNVELGCRILSDNIRRLGVEDGISAYFWGSNIRGVSYLNRVLEKRASVRRLAES